MKIEDAYLKMQNECGFGVGDKVKVLRKAKSYKLGWGTCWTSGMDEFVGKTFEVISIESSNGIRLNNQILLPWFVLELVEKKPEAKEMTVAEISKELGYEVKVVKG